MAAAPLSDYERRRLENIRQNQAILASLEIPTIEVADAERAGKGKRQRTAAPQSEAPRRVSSRILQRAAGDGAPMGIGDEVALYRQLAGEAAGRGGLLPAAPAERPLRVLGPIPFEVQDDDAFPPLMAFLSDERRAEARPCRGRAALPEAAPHNEYAIRGEFGVAKVVRERIYSMALHPTLEKVLVTVGSKDGSLGVWDATEAAGGCARDRHTFHFRPHSEAISNQRYSPASDAELLTASYDGMVRVMEMVRGSFAQIYAPPPRTEQYISALDVTHDGNVVLFTDTEGALTMLDRREGSTQAFQLHAKKAGGMSLSPVDQNYLATSSLDNSICLWDRRMLKAEESSIIERLQYGRAVTSVYFHPALRDVLISTCYDDHVRVHCGILSGAPKDHSLRHNNQTGRWITPFRAIWDPKCAPSLAGGSSRALLGGMARTLDVIAVSQDSSLQLHMTSSTSEFCTAQPAVSAIHAALDVVVSGSASGRCYVWSPAGGE